MKSDKEIFHKNRGVNRTKKPLSNIVYTVEVNPTLKSGVDTEPYKKYLFKNEGYLVLLWRYQSSPINNWHGFIEPEKLKEIIGPVQWAKFCSGKREFIIQRRVDGNNIKK